MQHIELWRTVRWTHAAFAAPPRRMLWPQPVGSAGFLMMFVLVQTVQSATGGNRPQLDATGPQTRALSQATAQFDPQTHLVTVEAPAPATVWNATPAIGSHNFVIPVRADAVVGPITAPLSPTPDETSGHLTLRATAWIDQDFPRHSKAGQLKTIALPSPALPT